MLNVKATLCEKSKAKDGRIKVYRENNKMVYEVPTYFEE